MSTTTPDAEVISAYQQNLIYNYSAIASLTIVCYEFLATFRHEYELVWKRRWTGATWLFLANRCYNYPFGYFLAVLDSIPTITIALFSALRVFALLGRTYILAVFTFALGLVPVAFNFYQISRATFYYVDDPVLGSSCYINYLISTSVVFDGKNYSVHTIMVLTHLTETLASLLSTIAADVIAITITWIKTYRHVREASSAGANVDFGAALLQYGSLFFIVLFIVNLIDALILLAPSLQSADTVAAFTDVLPNIVLSRFLINLRQINAQESGSAARFSQFSPPNFRMPSISSIVGNLGEPLADNEDDFEDDEDHVVAEVYEDGTHAAVNSGEEVEMADVMDIGRGVIEQVLIESV
ncbi:hypothetical protein NM688_g7946 [Phlebia brevispora]|uniref:Uncharacterized protein n=1 Tax=Phlebia brevispora TaxID=194682 RepID=A0ACC1RZA0_9APHY|nr:hypothetical protein NM688_g7946 [Phlebia brevispora]